MMTRRSKKRRKAAPSKASPRTFQYKEIQLDELKEILDRAKSLGLNAGDKAKLESVVDTLVFLTNELKTKGTSIRRLRKMIFGRGTDKKREGHGRDGASGYTGRTPTSTRQ